MKKMKRNKSEKTRKRGAEVGGKSENLVEERGERRVARETY
jgi:hypothetical protein